jgi:hypothetical protein
LSAGAVGTANVTDNAITYAKIQKVTAGKLLGRYSAAPATGDIQELTLGSGLSLDVGTGTITASFSPAIALTGPITGTYSVGTIPTTIADGVVGLNHLANLSPGTLIGRRSGGSASTPEAITLHSSLSMSVGGALSVTNPVTGSNTGDVTLGTANGLSLAGQALSMALATGSVVGTVSLAAQTFAGQKTFSNGILTNTIGAADASTVAFTANVADTGATTAFRFDVSPKLTVAGGKLFDVRNGTSGSLFNIDANNTATFLGPVLSSNMAFSELTAGQLAGRGSAAGPGGAQAISIGAGLTMSGTTLSATNTGTVTAVSVATANGVSGTSSGGATPALTISLGAITPSSVAATGTVSGSNIAATATLTAGASVSGTHSGTSSGSNTGDQAIALTGPITGTWSAGSIATTIAANAVTTTHITDANVTYAKIQNVNVSKVLGRASGGGVGPPEELNVTNGLTVNGNTLELAALTAGRLLGRNTGSAGQPQEVSLAGGLTLNGSAVLSLGTITPVGISFGTIHTPTASTNNTATVNYHKGTATIVAGESQFVLTNSLVTANSFVSVMFESPPCDVNTFAPVSYSVRPDAGSFSISFSNNTDGVSDPSAGNLTFRFFVIE